MKISKQKNAENNIARTWIIAENSQQQNRKNIAKNTQKQVRKNTASMSRKNKMQKHGKTLDIWRVAKKYPVK